MQGSDREGEAASAEEASGKGRGRLSVRIKLNSAAQPAQSQGAHSSPALTGICGPLPTWQLMVGRYGIPCAVCETALQCCLALQAWLAPEILM